MIELIVISLSNVVHLLGDDDGVWSEKLCESDVTLFDRCECC